MRSLHRSWKGRVIDGKLVPVRHTFTHRYRWYEQGEGENIRLNLEDTEGAFNHYPKSTEEAEQICQDFRDDKINARGKRK